MKDTIRHLTWFIVAGATGFVVDAGLLQLQVSLFDAPPILARIPSFLLAVVATWLINSRLTFGGGADRTRRQAGQYLLAMVFGGAINWIAFILFLDILDMAVDYPSLALVPATAISMSVNYVAMRFHIFRKDTSA